MDTIKINRTSENQIGPLSIWMSDLPLMKRYEQTENSLRNNLMEALHQKNLLLSAVTTDLDFPCGFAWIVPKGAFNRSPYLRLFGIHPKYTKRGIGTMLMFQVESKIKIDFGELFLLVSDFNVEAQSFYIHMGYLKIGEIPNYVIHGVNELIFRKKFKLSNEFQ